MRPHYIYYLVDPTTNDVRYGGDASHAIEGYAMIDTYTKRQQLKHERDRYRERAQQLFPHMKISHHSNVMPVEGGAFVEGMVFVTEEELHARPTDADGQSGDVSTVPRDPLRDGQHGESPETEIGKGGEVHDVREPTG